MSDPDAPADGFFQSFGFGDGGGWRWMTWAFTVDGDVVGDVPATARLRASVRNQRDFTVTFPGGVDVIVRVNRDGQRWQDVHLRNSERTTLAPGGVTELTETVALPGFGAYDLSGDVTYLGP